MLFKKKKKKKIYIYTYNRLLLLPLLVVLTWPFNNKVVCIREEGPAKVFIGINTTCDTSNLLIYIVLEHKITSTKFPYAERALKLNLEREREIFF